jgi:hypothetical protein
MLIERNSGARVPSFRVQEWPELYAGYPFTPSEHVEKTVLIMPHAQLVAGGAMFHDF